MIPRILLCFHQVRLLQHSPIYMTPMVPLRTFYTSHNNPNNKYPLSHIPWMAFRIYPLDLSSHKFFQLETVHPPIPYQVEKLYD